MSAALEIVRSKQPKPKQKQKTAQVVAIKKPREFTQAKQMLAERKTQSGAATRWASMSFAERRIVFFAVVAELGQPPEVFGPEDKEKSFDQLNPQQRELIRRALAAIQSIHQIWQSASNTDFVVKGKRQ